MAKASYRNSMRIAKTGLIAAAIATVIATAARGQTQTASADQTTCAALLSDNGASTGVRINPTGASRTDTATRNRADSVGFGIGGARNGAPDIILRVGVQIDQITFAKQPQVRVRLCWGGDTLRVVQRSNLPSPVVAGTTYRNVYVAVELLGRLDGQCLADRIGVGNTATSGQRARVPGTVTANATSVGNCAFLGGSAAGGATTPRQQAP